MTRLLLGILLCLALSVGTAEAKKRHRAPVAPSGGIISVSTAAGIIITVASSAAGKFQGFIGDLVAQGYKPRQIHCYARGGHVPNSNHYRGMACDIDQTGWNKTAGPMYRAKALAAKWGLRDGCTFRDCGHVDITPRMAAGKKEPENLYAATARYREKVAAMK